MQALTVMVTHAELGELRANIIPKRIKDALAVEAMRADPVDEIEIIACKDGMALHWHGRKLGIAHKYKRDNRAYWMVNLAPNYTRSIRRNTLPKLIDALMADVTLIDWVNRR